MRRGARGEAAAQPTPEPRTSGVDQYAETVSAYLAATRGTDGLDARTRDVLAAVSGADFERMSGSQRAGQVRRAARAAALEDLDAAARRPRRRLAQLVRLRWRCARTPDRLRRRDAGEISAGELGVLYTHLARCPDCGAVASRLESAGWRLMVEQPATSTYAAHPPRPGVGASDAIRPAAPPAPPAPRSPRTGRAKRWTRPGAVAGVALAGVLAAAAAVALTGGVGGGASHPQARGRTVPARARRKPRAAPTARGPRATSLHGLRDPFVVGRARYAVFRDPQQSWASFVGTDPGPGRQWVAVTVRVRNLGLPGFDPRVLAYRLVERTGAVYAPLPTLGTGPELTLGPRPLAPNGLVETRLGFRIPRPAAGLELRFTPVRGRPPIVVSLGP